MGGNPHPEERNIPLLQSTDVQIGQGISAYANFPSSVEPRHQEGRREATLIGAVGVVWSGDILIGYFAVQLAVSVAIELNVASSALPMGIAILLPGRINRLEVSIGIMATFAQNFCQTPLVRK